MLPRSLHFDLRYLLGRAPWNTGITPPEVKAFVAGRDGATGRALDLGCGTGTNTIYLAQRGWEAVGIDVSSLAILRARWKALLTGAQCRFFRADVTNLQFLKQPFDLALDIGCLHSLPPHRWEAYAAEVKRLTRPGACYMLYAFYPRPADSPVPGISSEGVKGLFTPAFSIERQEGGEDPHGPASAWYWLRRGSVEPGREDDR